MPPMSAGALRPSQPGRSMAIVWARGQSPAKQVLGMRVVDVPVDRDVPTQQVDLDQSLDFSCNKLGMVEIRRSRNEKGRYTLSPVNR